MSIRNGLFSREQPGAGAAAEGWAVTIHGGVEGCRDVALTGWAVGLRGLFQPERLCDPATGLMAQEWDAVGASLPPAPQGSRAQQQRELPACCVPQRGHQAGIPRAPKCSGQHGSRWLEKR